MCMVSEASFEGKTRADSVLAEKFGGIHPITSQNEHNKQMVRVRLPPDTPRLTATPPSTTLSAKRYEKPTCRRVTSMRLRTREVLACLDACK